MLKLSESKVLRSMLFLMGCLFVGFGNCSESHTSAREKSQEYFSCIDEAKAIHPKIVSCLQLEIERERRSMELDIDVASKDSSVRELVAVIAETNQSWVSYINKLCDAYMQLGGQRGELLSKNCLLNEVIHRRLFLERILEEASI